MQLKKLKWRYDKCAGYSYNIVGAFEIVLINLGVVEEEHQWDIDLMSNYANKYNNEVISHEPTVKDLKAVALEA